MRQSGWLALAVVLIIAVAFVMARSTVINLLSSPSTTSTTGTVSGLELVSNELTVIRGCSNEQVLKFDTANGLWECADDSTTTATGVGVVVLDLGDDDVNESTTIEEIATTGDTNSVFTEPTANKLLIDLAQNWPSSDTADALSANGTNCAAASYPLGVDAAGVSESCTAESFQFGTIAVPAGTNPVADNLTDTLTLAISGTMSVTGNATTDTLTFGLNNHPGTDLAADLEEETHASEHASGGNDILFETKMATWTDPTNAATGSAVQDLRAYFEWDATVQSARCTVDTAPTGSALTVQFIINAVTDIFIDGNRPSIAAGGNTNKSTTIANASISNGDYVKIAIEAVDSGDTAANLVCQLETRIAVFDTN